MNILETTCFNLGREGGVTSNLRTLYKGLKALGNNVIIEGGSRSYFDGLLALLKYRRIDDRSRTFYFLRRLDRQANKIVSIIKNHKIDIVNCHDVAICRYLLDKINLPIILTIHGPFSREIEMSNLGGTLYHNAVKEFERLCFKNEKLVYIAVDQGQKDILITDFNLPSDKIFVIHNCVDTSLFIPKDRKNKEKYLILPRRLVKKNGCHVAISAMKHVDEGIKLLVAGDGPEREMLMNLAKEIGVKERVVFLGEVKNKKIINLIANAVAVLIPSIPSHGVVEASSIAMLEGMSAGRPVIGSAIGGIKEIMKDGETGILVEPGSPESLAKAINWVLNNPKEAEELGQRARNYVIVNFSIYERAKRYLEIYLMAIKNYLLH